MGKGSVAGIRALHGNRRAVGTRLRPPGDRPRRSDHRGRPRVRLILRWREKDSNPWSPVKKTGIPYPYYPTTPADRVPEGLHCARGGSTAQGEDDPGDDQGDADDDIAGDRAAKDRNRQ
jgi:hypothetical protein